jgi:integrase
LPEWRIVFFQPITFTQKIISASLKPLEEKYEDFMAPFLILPEQAKIYIEKIRPRLAELSPSDQPAYFLLNRDGGKHEGANISNFFTTAFKKCTDGRRTNVCPHMIRHSVAILLSADGGSDGQADMKKTEAEVARQVAEVDPKVVKEKEKKIAEFLKGFLFCDLDYPY